MEQQSGFKSGSQGYVLPPCCFNLYAEYIVRNAGVDEAQAGIKIARRNINNLWYADNTTLMAESKERTKEPLDESERGDWKSWFKTQHSENWDQGIWSHHFMTNRWENNGKSDRLYFLFLFFGGVGAPKSLQMVTVAMKLKDQVGRLKKKIGRSSSVIYDLS